MTESADFDDVVAPAVPAQGRPSAIAPPNPGTPTDWRADPAWRLASWDDGFFDSAPGDVPPRAAELAQPDVWASLYDGRRIVATWSRVTVV